MNIQEYIQSGVIESYVLGLASEEEAAELLHLARLHPAVKQALTHAELAFEQQALATAETPAAGLQQQLLQQLQHSFEPAPGTAIKAPDATSSSLHTLPAAGSNNRWKYLAAASVILLVVSACLNFYFYSGYQQANKKYESLLEEQNTLTASINVYKARLEESTTLTRVLDDTAITVVKMPGVPGKETTHATVYWNSQSKDVYLSASQLPAVPAGKQYQLWAIVNGKPVDAGVINSCEAGICKMKNIPSAEAFAITLEQTGGSPVPTLTALYVMGKV
ncbi:anti-sigma-K factor RskA [Filimonas zeae]|uniref:Anti-sigma K factor RskA C-terminal domain-containing protein n=1 Tax=Filimonas zeae TaxID=1737353 RepID=A0A917J1E9_9BACT|nr:anti-sigma factor [Filimonas zeae]MDR6341082.1 anti-sigma-K factor RskA [Filimonas zeae]GGH77300.1 hypothetical protein GCM10011379_43440 [Filimonas zeae]